MTRPKPETEKIGYVSPFGLRMMPDLKASVEASAAANGRSMNAEIVARLEASGETLRDRFAMAALTGIIAAYAYPGTGGLPRYVDAAAWANEYADAMMDARKEGVDPSSTPQKGGA